MHQPKSRNKQRLALWGLGGVFLLVGCSHIVGTAFENQANRARESEADNYVGAMLRGQQAYFIEAEQFTDDLASLEINIPPETENYRYEIALDATGQAALVTATAKLPELRSFTGVAYAIADAPDEFPNLDTILCISDEPQQSPPAPPQFVQTGEQVEVVCAVGSQVAE
ncbi:MAG: type IV pilin-like G/H family protein [Leptolyngbya sp. SIO1E4]|nr:type IV pilin-like G/H family protein [Leptolyngbya sp. SIO1E4]